VSSTETWGETANSRGEIENRISDVALRYIKTRTDLYQKSIKPLSKHALIPIKRRTPLYQNWLMIGS